MRSGFARSAALALALSTVTTSSNVAFAGDARAVVVDCEGPHSGALASHLTAQLSANYDARDPSAFRRELGGPTLAAAEKDAASGAKLIAHARASARNIRADTAILVHARKTKRATVLHVWVVDVQGAGGAAVDQRVTLGPRVSVDDEANAVWNLVSRTLPNPSRAVPTPEATTSAASAPPSAPAESAETSPPSLVASEAPSNDEARDTGQSEPVPRSAHPHANAVASLGVSIQAGTRSFTYVDRITPSLRSYGSSLSPLVAIDGEIYPFARSRLAILRDFGITADYVAAFGVSAADSKGNAVSASWNAYDVGARERIRIGSAVLAGLHGGYGAIDYSFGDALGPAAQLPSMQYRFVRGGLDVSVACGRLTFYGSGSYLDVLSTGAFAAVFTRARAGGIEARAGATRTLGSGFELALEVAYTRFFYSLHPEPGDAYVAGGALDQLARLSFGVARTF